MARSDFGGDLKRNPKRPPRSWPTAVVGTKVVVGQSLWKASEVDSDQTLPVYIAKHGTLDTAINKVMVIGVSIALGVLVRVLPRGLP